MPTPHIFIPREPGQLKAAHDFHLKSVGEFLLPRTLDEFDALAKAGELWIAVIGLDVVASCYITREDAKPDAEFGGIIVHDDWKGTGLASAIGTVAIAAHFLHDPSPLIAHVHVDNQDPLPVLTKWLGFTKIEGKPAELNKVALEKTLGKSISMRADADGIIRGNTFGFSPKWLARPIDFNVLITGARLRERVMEVPPEVGFRHNAGGLPRAAAPQAAAPSPPPSSSCMTDKSRGLCN